MPPVIIGAAIGAGVSTAIAYYGVGLAVGATITSTFVANFAMSVAGSLAMKAFSGSNKPSGSFGAQTNAILGRDVTVRQAITHHRVVYGTSKVSGPIAFMESTENNKYLHMVILLASHKVTNISSLYIDDTELPNQFAEPNTPDLGTKIKITDRWGSATIEDWTFIEGADYATGSVIIPNPYFSQTYTAYLTRRTGTYEGNTYVKISTNYVYGYSVEFFVPSSAIPITGKSLNNNNDFTNFGDPTGITSFNPDTTGTDSSGNRLADVYLRPDGYTSDEYYEAIGSPDFIPYDDDEYITAEGLVVKGDYKGKIRVKFYLGAEDQEADPDLIAESNGKWTTDHRLQGIAYIYVRLEFDQDVFPYGIPNISAIVQGKEIYDPRTEVTRFSTNPALCIRDYLLDSTYGLGVNASELNEDSFISSANECDELVSLSSAETAIRLGDNPISYTKLLSVDGFSYTLMAAQGMSAPNVASQVYENRYVMNGTFDTNQTPKSIIENMITSCLGTFTYTVGEFALKAASYIAPSDTLTQNNLRAGISVKTKESRRDQFNSLKGVFIYQAQSFNATDYPTLTSSTFVSEDNNETVFSNLDFPYTPTPSMAQRLAKIALYANRQQLTLVFPCNLSAFKYQVGDNIMVNLDRYGFSSKVFEVASWALSLDQDENSQPAVGIDLVLKETSSAVFDWNADEKSFTLDNTILFNAKSVATPGLLVSDELRIVNEEAVSVLLVDVSSSNNAVSQFEVQARKQGDYYYVSLGKGGTGRYELLSVVDNAIYDVRARAINSLNVRSAFATGSHQVVGKTEPPADVTNFQVNITGTEAHLSWTPVPDLDLSHYVIRHSPLTSGAIYSNAITLVNKVSRPANTVTVPALTGTYFVRAVDKIALKSLNATSNVTLIENVKNFNFVTSSTQNPDFTGAKSNVFDIGNALILETALFDSVSGNFDDAIGYFDGGAGTVLTSGTYDFDTYIDTGGAYTSRVTATINMERLDYVNLFDDAQGNFDARENVFDGGDTFGDVNVELQIARTNGDPATSSYSPFQKFNVGDYTGRGFKFRAVLLSEDAEATPKVTGLSVTVDMAERVYSEKDIASTTSTSGKAITFSPAFKEISGIGISASNLTSGDYYVITSKSATGFTIEFFNSSNATIDRTFDYVVRGYGELAA